MCAGRLYQVEYAMEAISHAGAAVGILSGGGVVLAAEKRIASKLLEPGNKSDKMFRVDDHIAVAVAGITADANILINQLRLSSQQYTFQYQQPEPVEELVRDICDLKQGYTQYGGMHTESTSPTRVTPLVVIVVMFVAVSHLVLVAS